MLISREDVARYKRLLIRSEYICIYVNAMAGGLSQGGKCDPRDRREQLCQPILWPMAKGCSYTTKPGHIVETVHPGTVSISRAPRIASTRRLRCHTRAQWVRFKEGS